MSVKAPWFRCFPGNFLLGTAGMRPILFRTYTRLLMGLYEAGGTLANDDQKLKGLLELRPQDVRHLIMELVGLGKISVVEGVIHNGRTDHELSRSSEMNEKSSSISHPLEVHSISTDASVNGEWKPRRGKKRNKNHARAGDHAGAHASPPVEAEAEIESNKAQPPAEGLILSIDADASYALPPREDAAFAALGSDGRALASHPAQVQPGKGLMAALEPIPPEPEFSDEHRAMMLKRWADHLASLKPEPIGQPPVERDRNEVPVSKLKQRMEANGHDRPPEPIAPTHQPGTADDGGDHLRQEPLPGTDQAVDPNAGTPGPAPGRKAKRTGLMAVLPEEDDDAQA